MPTEKELRAPRCVGYRCSSCHVLPMNFSNCIINLEIVAGSYLEQSIGRRKRVQAAKTTKI